MRVRKLGSWVSRIVAVVAFGFGAVLGVATVNVDADPTVLGDASPSPDTTEWN